ncbi:DUF6178 family protein [Thermodesulfobacteriota bacterium]
MKKPRSTEEAVQIIETFDILQVDKKIEIFRGLSAQAREELLGVILRPGEIVRKISEEEMFFTVKQLGEENAIGHIALCTGKQLQYILDLDLWTKDVFDPRSAIRWLYLLARAGENKVVQFVQVSDPELVLTILRGFVKVQVVDPDTDLTEQLDYLPDFTLDDTFFIDFPYPGTDEFLKVVVGAIFQWNIEYYAGLMHELNFGASVETEELALKWRRARLWDHGFPSLDEAMEIYHYYNGRLHTDATGEESHVDSPSLRLSSKLMDYPLKVISAGNLLRRFLTGMEDDAERDRVVTQLAHLANKVMVADGGDPGVLENLQGSLEKVSGYINMALEDACADDSSVGSALLKYNHVETLFRRGFSLVLKVQREARKLADNYQGGIENMGYPLAGLIRGLLQKKPIFAANALGERNAREFSSLEDLDLIRRLMASDSLEGRWEPL